MNQKGSLKLLQVILLIIGIVIVGLISIVSLLFGAYWGGGIFGFIRLVPLAILGLLIWGLVTIARGKDNEKKVYKQEKPKGPMKIQNLFYIAGVIFIFLSVWYFAGEFLKNLPKTIQLILLIVSVIVSFVAAEFMRQGDI